MQRVDFPLTYALELIDRESTFGGVKLTVALRLQIYKAYLTALLVHACHSVLCQLEDPGSAVPVGVVV
jgi:hypothetical protein